MASRNAQSICRSAVSHAKSRFKMRMKSGTRSCRFRSSPSGESSCAGKDPPGLNAPSIISLSIWTPPDCSSFCKRAIIPRRLLILDSTTTLPSLKEAVEQGAAAIDIIAEGLPEVSGALSTAWCCTIHCFSSLSCWSRSRSSCCSASSASPGEGPTAKARRGRQPPGPGTGRICGTTCCCGSFSGDPAWSGRSPRADTTGGITQGFSFGTHRPGGSAIPHAFGGSGPSFPGNGRFMDMRSGSGPSATV
mmetsp:Transcript_9712/g.20085  ORF Transcript_9712/g.20085 Transcript_9712/m.20085 type:complete len:248 (+) Transcript_9712:678-1421(+)